MSVVSTMKAKLFVSDWAEVVAGKLYAQGIGWANVIADSPIQFAISCLIIIPFDETNKKHSGLVKLVTDDGQEYPPENPAVAGFDFEVGRPPGMRDGQEQIVPFALKIGGVSFSVGGYRVELYIDQEQVDTASFIAHSSSAAVGEGK